MGPLLMLGFHLKPKPGTLTAARHATTGEKGHVQAACPFKRAAETLRTKDEDVSLYSSQANVSNVEYLDISVWVVLRAAKSLRRLIQK